MREIGVFYDRCGSPTLRLLDNERLVDFDGHSIGFVDNVLFYSYDSNHVGWLEGGIIRDLNGHTVAFGENPTDSLRPYLPYKQYKPYPGYVEYEPYRSDKQYPNLKPFKSFGWSPLFPIELFLGDRNG